MIHSMLSETLDHLRTRSADAVVARGRLPNAALNDVLRRRLSAQPGQQEALLSTPIFEVAHAWEQAEHTLDSLSASLLHPRLVDALDSASSMSMSRTLRPYAHQLAAWRATREGQSCLVTSGTGSGKTECFMIPLLNDLLHEPGTGRLSGIRAIVIYPLNALIESQRARLNAWTEGLKDRVSYALFNSLTPEAPNQVGTELGGAELGDRKTIRNTPPSILITNVTMLEYLLLRTKDQQILERSQGLLRWIVLDEAHGYIGAQAAEMALLLRRVRAAFGVEPEQTRLIATSATISEGDKVETNTKLKQFVADLAGVDEKYVQVIEGQQKELPLPAQGVDRPLDPASLTALSRSELWTQLATHPRVQRLRHDMCARGRRLDEISKTLFGDAERQSDAMVVLDAAAQAREPASGERLLPWRAHLFHRAQGGFWACINPECAHLEPELGVPTAEWGFGALWLAQRDRCECKAPVFEIFTCDDCGAIHLAAELEAGVVERLVPRRNAIVDDYAIDEEPDPDSEPEQIAREQVWLRPPRMGSMHRFVCAESGVLYDNEVPEGARATEIRVIADKKDRDCCGSQRAGLRSQHYSSPFFMGTVLPDILERLAPPMNKGGLPMNGRRAITFSDSRQGVARLAAKLQQDAERMMTRSFLYHIVQAERGLSSEERAALKKRLQFFQNSEDPAFFADDIAKIQDRLSGKAIPIKWSQIVSTLGNQSDLKDFATSVWSERGPSGNEMAEHPEKLAEMFLYRELFRRPRVQNSAETMGLVQLVFPALEEKARLQVPKTILEAGHDADAWVELARAAVEFVFRDNFAVNIQSDDLARWINPRRPGRRSIFSAGTDKAGITEKNAAFWPEPKQGRGQQSRLLNFVFDLIKGDAESSVDRSRAKEVLDELWQLLVTTVVRDTGRGARRLDFSESAVVRVNQGWLCPITRRVLNYTIGGKSPYGLHDPRSLIPLSFPRLLHANAGGLGPTDQEEVKQWIRESAEVAVLRQKGIWSDLHDRIAVYPQFYRAQEHSAQIERPRLQSYETQFKEGTINFLNCSTTMEMGVDIPEMSLVANSNVPPSISNYRQRAGRAGRRGEPWAFTFTFCRDLPLDHVVFQDPSKFLIARITAPAVRFDSPQVLLRHVHAALLGAFLRSNTNGLDIKTSVGDFLGATDDANEPASLESPANNFLITLREGKFQEMQEEQLGRLVQGTVLREDRSGSLCAETAEAFGSFLQRWRNEYNELLRRAADAADEDVRNAIRKRASRMRGEFLLAELARRGFTPSYGFPVDVVSFDPLLGRPWNKQEEASGQGLSFMQRGGASRTLDVAIREYGPGAEIIIDGLVHKSEGILPAWSAMADTSGLEDLQTLWECKACHMFGLVRSLQDIPEQCPYCNHAKLDKCQTIRPAGFLGGQKPHTGYESLGHIPFEMPKLALEALWQSLPNPGSGRMRGDKRGHLVTKSSGKHGYGYALCLCCGRSEAETDINCNSVVLRGHKPLAPIRKEQWVGGACPGGQTRQASLKRGIHLIHETHTDIFELQLPRGATRGKSLALAAALREALAERIGAEARELGIAARSSKGAAGESAQSLFIFDKAAGGAGLSTRLVDFEWFGACLERAVQWLDCKEQCKHGCPSCILRPDMNYGEDTPDRPGALELAKAVNERLILPQELRLFGSETQFINEPLFSWLERRRLSGKLNSLTLYLHGAPDQWELARWAAEKNIKFAAEAGTKITIALAAGVVTDKDLDLADKLCLFSLGKYAKLAVIPALPMAGSAPVLLIAESAAGTRIGVAASDPVDGLPDSNWGSGQTKPLVCGSVAKPGPEQAIAIEQLIKLSAGNARLLRLGRELDGPVTNFGKRFWEKLENADPLNIRAMRITGLREVNYNDRYLVTPLNFRLLQEVLVSIPGRAAGTKLEISTAAHGHQRQTGSEIFHQYPDDRQRQLVLEHLFPGAIISIISKGKQAHARKLELILKDGRRLQILLDQGFGAWRADGDTRYDFSTTIDKQTAKIRMSKVNLFVAEKEGTPVILQFS